LLKLRGGQKTPVINAIRCAQVRALLPCAAMHGCARLGTIAALMLAAACGGKLAPIPEATSRDDGPLPSDDGHRPSTKKPDASTDDRSITGYEPEPAATVVDLTNDDAARVCVDRAAAEKTRSLGKFRIESGWNTVAHAIGVEAAVWIGGMSTGGPITAQLHIDLTFPLPVTFDAARQVRTEEELVYELDWPGPEDPKDLFVSGTTAEVDLHDKGWVRACSAKGTYYSYDDPYPPTKVTVTITERSEQRIRGSLEKQGPYGTERLVFDAPIGSSTGAPALTSPEICCLR
jgi:hypothetical protein